MIIPLNYLKKVISIFSIVFNSFLFSLNFLTRRSRFLSRSTTEVFDSCDPYQLMVEQCGEVMREGTSSLMSNEDSLRLAATLDQVRED